MNIIDKNKYYEFSHVLSGCRTILDSYYFAEKYSKTNPETKTLVTSMINGKKYHNVLDFKTMKSIIETLDDIKYKDEADKIINEYMESTIDPVQLKTLLRITKSKILRPLCNSNNYNYNDIYHISKNNVEPELITKSCPHCNRYCIAPIDTEYIICGYNNTKTGYDLVGCGKDWCFKCGKILCKKWDLHKLFLEINKSHNDECCKQHAKNNNKIYPDNYCQCYNLHVQRKEWNCI